jgi:thioredoxin 1
MRKLMMVAVVVAIAGVLTTGVVLAQGVTACDVPAVGAQMIQQAQDGNFEAAAEHAQTILASTESLEGKSPTELYYIGMAHRYMMAHAMDMAVAEGLPGEQKEEAIRIADSVMAPAVEDVRTVAHGERVELTDYLVPGQTVIFDFYSKYCPPCMQIGPHIEALAKERDDIVLVKVDINRPGKQGIDWQSPVAQQYSLRGIPHFKIYGPDGQMQAEGQQARSMVMGWLQ